MPHLALVGPLHPYRGGIAHFTETMRRGLAARGHRVTALTFRRQYPELLFPGKTQYADGPPPEAGAAPRVLDSINPLTWLAAARRLRREAPDAVVYAHWMPFFAPAYGTMARRLHRAGIPALALVHNALPHERRPGDLALSRYLFGAVDGALVMSEAVEGDLQGLGMDGPLRRVPHPTYEIFGDPLPRADARRRLALPEDAEVLLFFGLVRRYKGLHVLLDAFPEIAAARPDAHLVVAGEFYEDEAPYREAVARHGLEGRVHFHARYIPDEDVGAFFSAADVVVQPYVTATQSGVAQIAFQFDAPLVVTDVGGLPEIVPHEEAGLVVPPEDPAALAAAVTRFFAEEMGPRLAAGVRRERAKYSWDRLYEALEELLSAVSE